MNPDSKANGSSFKAFVAKAISRNPISGIIFKLFKKRISFNHVTIRVISFLHRQRLPFHDTTIDVSDKVVTPMIKSLLYYQIYEDVEVAFANQYLKENDDVIELGSSIGVMGCIISHKQTTGRYISVEADPALINVNRKNIALNRKADFVLINKAVDYFNKTVSFSVSDNSLRGKVQSNGENTSRITIETITLSEICDTYNLEKFTLVSDIEGAEITILLNDRNALNKCEKMIIELHDTEYNGKTYLVQDMVNLITDSNFSLLDQKRNVYVFAKTGINV